ncbi:MAG: toprim domain-containing protein [Rhodospirillaceae bacterium]
MIDPDRVAGLGPLIIAEGYSTASTMHETTGRPVAVAFDAGNLKPVAEALRGKYPNTAIVIAADNDHHLEAKNKPNTGVERANGAAQAVNGLVIVPAFTEAERSKGLAPLSCTKLMQPSYSLGADGGAVARTRPYK